MGFLSAVNRDGRGGIMVSTERVLMAEERVTPSFVWGRDVARRRFAGSIRWADCPSVRVDGAIGDLCCQRSRLLVEQFALFAIVFATRRAFYSCAALLSTGEGRR